MPPEPLAYRTVSPADRRYWHGPAIILLTLGQVVWICPWGILIQGSLVDGDPKNPVTDFFFALGTFIPSIGIIGVCLLRLFTVTGRRTPYPRRPAYQIALLVGLALVGLAICGWIHDDVVNRDVPYGGTPPSRVPPAPMPTTVRA